MRSTTILAAGSWALALLVGFFIWLSPDSTLYPTATPALVVIGLAWLLWVVGVVMTAFPRSAPRLSTGAQLGALAPLFAAAAAVVAAGRGILHPPSLPLVFILGAGIGTWSWSRKRSPEPGSRLQEAGLTVLLALSVLIIAPALAIAALGQQIWLIGTPNYATMISRFEAAGNLSRYRPAPREGISAEAAGRAMFAIALTGDVHHDTLFVEVPGRLDRPWIAEGGPFGRRSGDSVMMQVLAGLGRGERAWLEEAVRHPGLPLLDSVAYAAKLDPWVALRLPLPQWLNAFALPVPPVMPLRDAARLQLYRAALAAADRRPAVADSLIRQVIGLGLRLRDDGDQLILAVLGAAIAREAGSTLAELRSATGRTAEGDSIRALTVIPPVSGTPPEAVSPRPMELRRQMIAGILAHSAPRPVEWDVAGFLGVSPCTNLRELFYGPTDPLRAAYDALAVQVGPSPGAQAAFEVIRRGITLGPGEAERAPFLLRLTGFAIGRTTGGACLASMALM